jgi:hypothetical protein
MDFNLAAWTAVVTRGQQRHRTDRRPPAGRQRRPIATDLWLGSDGVAATVSQATGTAPDSVLRFIAVEGVRLERNIYLMLPSAGETSPAARRFADQLLRIHPAAVTERSRHPEPLTITRPEAVPQLSYIGVH